MISLSLLYLHHRMISYFVAIVFAFDFEMTTEAISVLPATTLFVTTSFNFPPTLMSSSLRAFARFLNLYNQMMIELRNYQHLIRSLQNFKECRYSYPAVFRASFLAATILLIELGFVFLKRVKSIAFKRLISLLQRYPLMIKSNSNIQLSLYIYLSTFSVLFVFSLIACISACSAFLAFSQITFTTIIS